MGKYKVENNDLKKFIVLIFSKTVDEGGSEQSKIRTGCDYSDYRPDKKYDTPFLNQSHNAVS